MWRVEELESGVIWRIAGVLMMIWIIRATEENKKNIFIRLFLLSIPVVTEFGMFSQFFSFWPICFISISQQISSTFDQVFSLNY